MPLVIQRCNISHLISAYGSGADPGPGQSAVQVTEAYIDQVMLPLLSARPTITIPTAERHRPYARSKLYCLLITDTSPVRERLAQVGCPKARCWLVTTC